MKICPKCQKEHNANGFFCSPACAHARTFNSETRRLMSVAAKNRAKGIVNTLPAYKRWKQSVQPCTIERFNQGLLVDRGVIYKVLVALRGNQCSICPQVGEWYGKPLRLLVDHVDGNAGNNQPENLRLVCPHCSSQLPTFGARNKGNGRKVRGLPMQ